MHAWRTDYRYKDRQDSTEEESCYSLHKNVTMKQDYNLEGRRHTRVY